MIGRNGEDAAVKPLPLGEVAGLMALDSQQKGFFERRHRLDYTPLRRRRGRMPSHMR
jgi:hypothetical protein